MNRGPECVLGSFCYFLGMSFVRGFGMGMGKNKAVHRSWSQTDIFSRSLTHLLTLSLSLSILGPGRLSRVPHILWSKSGSCLHAVRIVRKLGGSSDSIWGFSMEGHSNQVGS